MDTTPLPQVCESTDLNNEGDVPLVNCTDFSQLPNDIQFFFVDPTDGKLKKVEFGCLVQSISAGGNRRTYRNPAEAANAGVNPGEEWILAKDNDVGMLEGIVVVQPSSY